LLTVEQAAAYAAISRSRMYELVAQGTIPSVKIGKSRRVPRAAVESWVAQMLAEQGASTRYRAAE
jgi:excisionase family DNA binding protein